MAESRPRNPYPEVIIRNDLKSYLRWFIESFITIVCWAVYVYILLPLVTLLLWLLGFQTMQRFILGDQGYSELIKILKNGGMITLIIVLLLIGWTYYNLLFVRIKGERRNSCSTITPNEDVALLLKLEVSQLEDLKNRPVLHVKLEKDEQYIISPE
ncbi:MAG: poly-beta-1,6-N-acetyl-D-glucosamine biosynthesis protein PgaD [Desulfobacca sp. 4484_104]|nr:MAG: poly-beta-1,6-N-acetyl-D-glucosamine biosynthesis protein PgaD [Desulfobacca sp. 4484_104]RLA87254.1 MAG: poly-beta-1,6-N-acetyl-D-glucosamine biosynthesis protein PgaD [Deltaproteobacteria bacterium]